MSISCCKTTLLSLTLSLVIVVGHRAVAQTLSVTQVLPAENVTSAPADDVISVAFNKEIDPGTVTPASFRVFGRWSGPMTGVFAFPVSNVDGFSFIPDAPFFYGEQVLVSVAKTITDTSGSPMDTGYQWSYWTAVTGGSMDFIIADTIDIREPGEGSILAYGAYAGDLNNDGWSDLLVPNETPDDFRVFMNDAAGGFSNFTIYEMPESNSPSTNEGADFNNDGEIDVVIGSGSGRNISVFMGTGSGTFQPETAYEAGIQGAWIRGVCVP